MALNGSLQDFERANFTEVAAEPGIPVKRVKVMNDGSSPVPVTFTASNITTPVITNLSVPTANTEVSHVLQTNLKRIIVKCRGLGKIQLAFTATESSTKYITIHPGATYSEEGLNLSGQTLYLQTSLASQVVEILEWT
jgi:hypothetical protein